MANEEIESVTTSAPSVRAGKRPGFSGMSPLQVGLLYGSAAAAVGGPIGLLAGLGFGIAQKRIKENFLDKEARYAANLRAEHDELTNEIDTEMQVADPDEQRLLSHAKRLATDGWYRLQAGDETGREMVEQANAMTRSIMLADSNQRKQEEAAQAQFQRGLVGSAANEYRNQYQQGMSQFEAVDEQSSRVLDLVSQPDFDPNKPFNKAILAELLSTGIGGFFKDAPDIGDAFVEGAQGLRGIPVVGDSVASIIGGITTAFKAEDFKVSKEDYNRIALNMKKYATQLASKRMERLGQQGLELDDFARKTGAIPADYSLRDYISGGNDELKLNPVPEFKPQKLESPTRTTIAPTRSTPTKLLQAPAGQWNRNTIGKRPLPRPTN